MPVQTREQQLARVSIIVLRPTSSVSKMQARILASETGETLSGIPGAYVVVILPRGGL